MFTLNLNQREQIKQALADIHLYMDKFYTYDEFLIHHRHGHKKPFYVYGLFDCDYIPFYIGKGTSKRIYIGTNGRKAKVKPRATVHITEAIGGKVGPMYDFIRNEIANNRPIYLKILHGMGHEPYAFIMEAHYIYIPSKKKRRRWPIIQ